jgi:YbbR domain-containing protein
VRITVPIQQQLDYKTVALHVPLDGEPAPGFRVTDINLEPTTLIVQGSPALLAGLNVVETAHVSLAGITQTVGAVVSVTLPSGVTPSPNQPLLVNVRVEVEEITTRMSQSVRIRTIGLGAGLEALINPDRIEVRVSGPFDALQDVDPNGFSATIDLTGQGPGTFDVELTAANVVGPLGTRVIGFTPQHVTVTITTLPTPSPAPSPSPPDLASPVATPFSIAPLVPPGFAATAPIPTPPPTPTRLP